MTRKYRLRKLFAPTAGLRRGLVAFLLGNVAFFFGLGLSFQNVVRPVLVWFSQSTTNSISALVPGDQVAVTTHYVGGIMLVLGAIAIVSGVRAILNHIIDTLNPGLKAGKVDAYLRRLQLAEGPRIVAIGGGTGLSTVLRGLKQQTSNITAIVTVTDDGGSSGRLSKEKGMIPPGDIRNCLVALADAEKAMTDLFQHRFGAQSGALTGHSLGNLLLAGLADQAGGDFDKAVTAASSVLAIRGRVIPATLDPVQLRAVFSDGTCAEGETTIAAQGKPIDSLSLLPDQCQPHPAAIEAIRNADLICIGPGSVYTSIAPNLLVPGIVEAILASPAPKVYICNVMTQPGESEGFSASQHALAIQRVIGQRVFDYVLVNTGQPSENLLSKYQSSGQNLVEPDQDVLRQHGYRPLPGNYMNETDVVRHDAMRVAERLVRLLETN